MDHREALNTIARLTFPDREYREQHRVSIRCADYIERDEDCLTIDWLVDLANIERVGPNVVSTDRHVLPLNTGDVPVLPMTSAEIVVTVQRGEFRCNRLVVSDYGTPGGSADWIIDNISIGNRSQFVQEGALPGDMFANNAIESFVSFEVAMPKTDIVVVVTYIGTVEIGVPFRAVLHGSMTAEPLPQYVRIRDRRRTDIQRGFAYVSKSPPTITEFDDEARDIIPRIITISIPSIDAAILDVAIDSALTNETRTPAIDATIAQAVEGDGGIIHDAYVALVMQRAEELRAGEAR